MLTAAERWDTFYNSPENVWTGPPLPTVEKYINDLKVGLTADLGAGNGRDALFIANSGGEVFAYDVSEVGLKKLVADSKSLKVTNKIHTVVRDLNTFVSDGSVRNVVSSFTLHFLTKKSGKRLIHEMQGMTKMGGLNIIADFSTPFPTETSKDHFYPGIRGIEKLYTSWKILESIETERKTRQLDERGNVILKHAFEFVARKDF